MGIAKWGFFCIYTFIIRHPSLQKSFLRSTVLIRNITTSMFLRFQMIVFLCWGHNTWTYYGSYSKNMHYIFFILTCEVCWHYAAFFLLCQEKKEIFFWCKNKNWTMWLYWDNCVKRRLFEWVSKWIISSLPSTL
jgi:hypothetical protein